MKFPKVYLASASPRRRELLTQIGVDFSVLNVAVDESVLAAETPSDYAKRIALAKAQAGWETLKTDYRPVIGADTAVVLPSQQILDKPENLQQAEAFLLQLSASRHQVLSAVAIVWQQQHWLSLQISDVQFKKLSSAEIDWYLATGEGKDKAGGYGTQAIGAFLIKEIRGCYYNVMGLPIHRLIEEIMKLTSKED